MKKSWEDILSYRPQIELLQERKRFMEVFHPRDTILKNDARLFDELRAVSEEKLEPVMVWPEQGEPSVGYLVQRTGTGSFRVLLCLNDWKLIRVKPSARIWRLKNDEAFRGAVAAQQECDRAIGYIMKTVHATPHVEKDKKKRGKLTRTARV